MFDRLNVSVPCKAALLMAATFSAAAFNAQTACAAADPVVLTFSTVGDSRQDPVKIDPTVKFDSTSTSTTVGNLSGQDRHWLQNTKAFSRILRTIQTQKPSLLFFNGDMIMGYGKAAIPAGNGTTTSGWTGAVPTVAQVNASDLSQFNMQYGFWRGMVAPVMETGTYVVPVPGNHETECNSANQTDASGMIHPVCASGKKAVIENEANWTYNMGDLILDTTRFQNMFSELPTNTSFDTGGSTGNPDADGLVTDQSKLSYSFDFHGSHFVVINTDPVGKDSHAPTAWLTADLAAAQSRGNTHFFVFGHKPAYTYDYLGNGLGAASNQVAIAGLDSDIPARDTFWALIEQYGATYFCGHEHLLNVQQPKLASGGSAYQVLVGGGGSPFDPKYQVASLNPTTDRAYSWATVSVHQSGAVDIKAYGFSDAFGPTMQFQTINLPH